MHELHQWRDEVENTTPPCFARVLTVGPDVRCIAFHYWAWARQRNISFRDCIGRRSPLSLPRAQTAETRSIEHLPDKMPASSKEFRLWALKVLVGHRRDRRCSRFRHRSGRGAND